MAKEIGQAELKVIEIYDTGMDVFDMPLCPFCGQPLDLGSSDNCIITQRGVVGLAHGSCIEFLS